LAELLLETDELIKEMLDSDMSLAHQKNTLKVRTNDK
tara:strand:+ start:7623 stop:7733 length:111 start_codon:yes stop_codon:yes gene_type:complete